MISKSISTLWGTQIKRSLFPTIAPFPPKFRFFAQRKIYPDTTFKKWRPGVLENATNEELLSGFLNLPQNTAEQYVKKCMELLKVYKDQLDKIVSSNVIEPGTFLNELKVSKTFISHALLFSYITRLSLSHRYHIKNPC